MVKLDPDTYGAKIGGFIETVISDHD